MTPPARIRAAYDRRAQTDYVFTGPGLNIFLTIITCGIFGFYLFYQLMRRDRDHNQRRLEFLEAANVYAWELASERGLVDELRPAFDRIAGSLGTMQRLTREFRDPTVWVVIDVVGGSVNLIFPGIAQVVGFIFIDQDFDAHDRAEVAIEADLGQVYTRLGLTLPSPDPARVKGKHNYAGRVIASVFTCGIYLFWWLRDMQVEGNRHVEGNWPFEDAVVAAVAASA
jgi:hypothetical protein